MPCSGIQVPQIMITELRPNGITPDDGSKISVAAVSKIPLPDLRNFSRLFDENYYQTNRGRTPYGRSEDWLSFFSSIAEHIVRSLRPRKVLDAGCAMGMLVESFWDRGVETHGIDISPYAICQVRRDVKPFCTVGSITDPIDTQYDLVVCLEVIEHVPSEYERTVIQNLCSATNAILFSSALADISDATHFNARPAIYWLRAFSEFEFWPDLTYDASFVAPNAMLLRRSGQHLPSDVLELFAETIRQRLAVSDRKNRIRPLEKDLKSCRDQLAENLERQTALNAQLVSTTARLHEAIKERARLGTKIVSVNRLLDEAFEERSKLNKKLDIAGTQLQTLSEKADARETSFREEVKGLESELRLANQQLNEIFVSPGWGVIRRYRSWVERKRRVRPRLFSRYERVALWMLSLIAGRPEHHNTLIEAGAVSHDASVTREDSPSERGVNISKFLLIISGGPDVSYKYRAEHQAEEIGLFGLTVDTALFDAVDYEHVLQQYGVFVLHRVPHTASLEDFIKRAKIQGKPVIFDTDDLVFNERFIGDIRAIRDYPLEEYNLHLDGIRRYYRTLSLCHAALVSTEDLRDRIKELFPEMPVYVNRNAVNDEMVAQAEYALKHVAKIDDGSVRIIYMSGTRTHNEDFAQCVAALERLLEAHPQLRLMIVGLLDLPERLRRWTDRLEVTPLIPWQELPGLMRQADINLAPLELENAFTHCKSELKYFEAGLLELPTVASQVPAFQNAITPGENGFLCRSEQAWFDSLERLILSPTLRREIGSRARQDVLARYTTRSRAPELTKALRQIFDDLRIMGPRRLSIAIVTQAPIAQTGGGYKNIFRIGNWLADHNHDVHIYVEAIAHLAGLTDAEIVAYCNQYFGRSAATIHVGHDRILPSDVALATAYPTAYAVNNITNTRCKTYLIQDYEPEFSDRSDPGYERAERTYDLPLKKIALGKFLQTLFSKRDRVAVAQIPFALDLSNFRNLKIRSPLSIRVLFFARPSLKRRAYPVGVEALRILADVCPEVEIAFYGMSEPEDLGFNYKNLGELSPDQVATEMNQSHIHLSFSLTNISWVPFEAMACGCAVVEAKVPSVEIWMEDDSENCMLVEPNPRAVADALIKLVRDSQMRDRIATNGEKFVATISSTWEQSCEQMEKILLEAVFRDAAPAHSSLITPPTNGIGQNKDNQETSAQIDPGLKCCAPTEPQQAPVVIGAIGGSGTRILARITREAGFFIGTRLNESADSVDFAEFSDRWINRYIRREIKPLTEKETSQMRGEFEECLVRHRCKISKSAGSWGWKEPRSIYLLPFLYEYFPQMKFLHLVRDGRDMAFSGNQNQLNWHGHAVLDRKLMQAPQPVRTAALWNTINLTAASFGETYLRSRYLSVRFEDLCSQPAFVIERVLSFLGVSHSNINFAIDDIRAPESIGRWKQMHDQRLLEQICDQARLALDKFGYV
jgi:glycosyltransferase involved in cell wall biosynthesis/2-polyprenyl-3-methyl-5-hydroxy-6-metoxy-1,4-benzoquinol methylase